ncbi:MFS transporter [Sulfobacillus thermosulfidooxidans]|uniref:MFS transporter n=1 Tax=Sulfobacillus thermosulfidooxidans TaxID=28034 RepID=UPI0006B5BBBA|nr:MFS transporter [Sulfobacillus thermosulfidooxidans]
MNKKWTMLILIWLMMFVAYLDRINISVAGPMMMKGLHMSPALFGVVLSAFTFGYAILQIPGGWLADRFGARTLLVVALVWWSVFTGLTGLAIGATMLIVTRVLFGVGEGLENGAQFKLIGDFFTSKERSWANGLFLTAIALGPAFVAPVSTWLLGTVGWRALFLLFTIPGIIMAVLIYFLIPVKPPGGVVHTPVRVKSGRHLNWKTVLEQPGIWLVFLAYLFFNVAFWGFLGWMPSYLSLSRHIDLSALGFDASVPYVLGFFGLVIIGWIGTRIGRYKSSLVAISYLVSGIFLYMAYNAHTIGGTVFALSAAAFFLFGGFGPIWAIPLDLIPDSLRGTFTGFVNFGGQIGGFFAPIVVGIIVTATHSFTGGFLFMIGGLIASAICLLILQSLSKGLADSAEVSPLSSVS